MDDEVYDNTSEIGKLIKKLEKLRKKPQLDNELGCALDIFRNKVSRQTNYLVNGIFTINFAESALFIQSCAELYSKKIDLLWDLSLEFHTRLIQYDCEHQKKNGVSVDSDAVSKLEERRNRFKRKKNFKLVVEDEQPSQETVTDLPVAKDAQLSEVAEIIKKSRIPIREDPFVDVFEIEETNDCKPKGHFKREWKMVMAGKHDRKYTAELLTSDNMRKSIWQSIIENDPISDDENDEIFDVDDGDCNAQFNDAPHCGSYNWFFRENDLGCLPDHNHFIASLRLSSYMKAKFMCENKIRFNTPFNEYKDKYLEFKKNFFAEEDKRWQNMPINTLADIRKRNEYITKMYSPFYYDEKELAELKAKGTLVPYKDYYPINGKWFKIGICQFLPYADSDASILSISDTMETGNDKDETSGNLQKLSDSCDNYESGYISIKEEFDPDDTSKDMSQLDKEIEDNGKSMNDEAISDLGPQLCTIDENKKDDHTMKDVTETDNTENMTNENIGTDNAECSISQNTDNPEGETTKENTGSYILQSGEHTEAVDAIKENAETEQTTRDNVSQDPDNLETENIKNSSTEIENSLNNTVSFDEDKENTHNNTIDNSDVISIMSDHDYCLPNLSNVLKDSTKNNVQVTTNLSEKFVPMSTASKIILKNVPQRVAKENKYMDPLMKPPPAKRRKLSQKQIQKLLTSKIQPVKEMKFEKFFCQNYQPALDEGQIQQVEYESDEEAPAKVAEPTQNPGNNVQSKPSEKEGVRATSESEKDKPQEIVYSDDEDGEFLGFGRPSNTQRSQSNKAFIDPELQELYEKRVAEVKEQRRQVYAAMNIDPKEEEEKYLKQQKEERESKKRVQEWTQFITPILQKTSEKDFDVHEYEAKLMDQMEIDETIPFKSVVDKKPAAEVIRFFVASLHLANTENIEISGGKSGELSNDTFSIKLLKRDRYHEHLAQYEAPSIENFREKIKRMRQQDSVTEPVEQIQPVSKRQRLERTQKKRKRKYVVSSSDEEDSGYEADSSISMVAGIHEKSFSQTPVSRPKHSYSAKRSKGSGSNTPNPIKGKSIIRKRSSEISTYDINTPSTSGTCWTPTDEAPETPSYSESFQELSSWQMENSDIPFHSTPCTPNPNRPPESPSISRLFCD